MASGLASGNEMHSYISREDDHTGHRILKDTKTIGSAYDRYLQSAVTSLLSLCNLFFRLCFSAYLLITIIH